MCRPWEVSSQTSPLPPTAASTCTDLQKPTMASSSSEGKERDITSNSPQIETPENEPQADSNPSASRESPENQKSEISDQSSARASEESDLRGEVEEDEEEGECGFCLFMKGGGCRDSFIAWEKCVEDAEKNKEDVVEKCMEVTGLLKQCMEAHADYYEPILKAEKAAEQEVAKELEREAATKESKPEAVSEDKKES